MSIKKSLLGLVVLALAMMGFASSAMAATGGLVDITTGGLPVNHVFHFVGWAKFTTARGSFECHVTAEAKFETALTGKVTAFTVPDTTKCTGTGLLAGCKLKAGHQSTNLPYHVAAAPTGEPTDFDVTGSIVIDSPLEGFLCSNFTLKSSGITLKPLKEGTRTVTGTAGKLGITATEGEAIAGVEISGTGTAEGSPFGNEAATFTGELELTDADRGTWHLHVPNEEGLVDITTGGLPVNHVFHFVGWAKFTTARGSFECHVTAEAKFETALTGKVTAFTVPDTTKCTGTGLLAGCKLKAGHQSTNLPYHVAAAPTGEPTDFDVTGSIVIDSPLEGFLCSNFTLKSSGITLKPLKEGTRTVTGTAGKLGITATEGEAIAGVEISGTGTAEGSPFGNEAATFTGELELTDADRGTWHLHVPNEEGLVDITTGGLPVNHVFHFVGWAKFTTARGSFECHVTAEAKFETALTGKVTAFTVPDTTKCTGTGLLAGCKLKAGHQTNLPYHVAAAPTGEPTDFDVTGSIVIDSPLEGFLCPSEIKLTSSAITLKPLKEGTRTVTGTAGKLGITATEGEAIAGVEISGTGIAHTPFGEEAATFTGELELTEADRGTWQLVSS